MCIGVGAEGGPGANTLSMLALLLPVILPPLISETAKLARRAMKELRKSKDAEHAKELADLRARLERLELAARWTA